MEISQIVEKFFEKNWLIGSGASKIANYLGCTKEEVYEARKEYYKQLEYKEEVVTVQKPVGKLKSRWQNASGEWLESYRFDNEEEESIDMVSELLNGFKLAVKEVETRYDYNPEKLSGGKILNIYLSDQHIGASVETGLYSNKFDSQVFKERMFIIFDTIMDIQKSYRLSKLNVIFLGDTFDGMDGLTVKRTHDLPQNMSNKECFETFISTHISFFDALIDYEVADSYGVYFQPNSNHGGDMDYMGFKAIEMWLNQKYPFVKTKIFDKFIGLIKEGFHTFMITHGKDQRDMKFGLPLHINDKAELYINQFIDMNRLNGELHFVKGDLHQSATEYCKKFRYKNVGSIFGSSSWIMANFGYTRPMCNYDIFDETNPSIIEGVIHLD
jgi:hypothetical protein